MWFFTLISFGLYNLNMFRYVQNCFYLFIMYFYWFVYVILIVSYMDRWDVLDAVVLQ